MAAAPHLVTVFDIGTVGFNYWWWLGAFGFVVVISVTGIRQWRKAGDPQSLKNARLGTPIACLICVVLPLCGFENHDHYRKLQAALANGHYDVVQGDVENFRPGKTETFDVGGVQFSYSPYDMTSMFNTTSGSMPDVQDRYVRIAHVGNDIVRLDMAQ
jgi:hypothetical protein